MAVINMAVEVKTTTEWNPNRPYPKCPECGSAELVHDYARAEVFCTHCGSVIAEKLLDLGPEWRAYDHKQFTERARTGSPSNPRYFNNGLGSPHQKTLRVKKTIISSTEKNLTSGLNEVDRLANLLKLPRDIKNQAFTLYRKTMKKGLTRGKSTERVVASILFIVCNRCDVPRTLKEISNISQVISKEILSTVRLISEEFNIKIKPTYPYQFIPRFCSLLNLSSNVWIEAVRIANEAKEKGITNGVSPVGVAAAAILIAATIMHNKNITEKKIAEVTGVTETTISKRKNEMEGK